jgi:hypothetical protein
MAYFGWPAAHDNDAERAVHPGVMILDAIAKHGERPAQPKLSALLGIDLDARLWPSLRLGTVKTLPGGCNESAYASA